MGQLTHWFFDEDKKEPNARKSFFIRFLLLLPISGEEKVGDDGRKILWQQMIKNTQKG